MIGPLIGAFVLISEDTHHLQVATWCHYPSQKSHFTCLRLRMSCTWTCSPFSCITTGTCHRGCVWLIVFSELWCHSFAHLKFLDGEGRVPSQRSGKNHGAVTVDILPSDPLHFFWYCTVDRAHSPLLWRLRGRQTRHFPDKQTGLESSLHVLESAVCFQCLQIAELLSTILKWFTAVMVATRQWMQKHADIQIFCLYPFSFN